MTSAVVDASVAAKWVVEEEHSARAATMLSYDALHAPAHWRAEAANVLWAKVFRGDLTGPDAEERLGVLMRADIIETDIVKLMPDAFAIALTSMVTVYDALYVALAASRHIPFVTADERLIRPPSGPDGCNGAMGGFSRRLTTLSKV